MYRFTYSRRVTLGVLVAYLTAHTLGALLHEQLHAHTSEPTTCQAHDHAHGHEHVYAGQQHTEHETPAPEGQFAAPVAAHDHDCVVCRVSGQPVVSVATAQLSVVADVCPDALPCPAAAPRTLAERLAHSRAPPSAV